MQVMRVMHSFDRETALARLDERTFTGIVAPGWSVGRGANGGFVAALLLRALAAMPEAEGRDARSLTIHYLAPAEDGPVRIVTAVERAGRTLATLSARMTQDEKPVAVALAAFARSRTSIELADAVMPDTPPPEAVAMLDTAALGMPRYAEQYDYRWAVGDAPFSRSAHAVVGGWMRLREPRAVDAPLAAAYLDGWIPCLYPRLDAPVAAPTIDLTIHFRRPLPLPDIPPDEYCLVVFRARLASNGFFDEEGELWSRDGRLLAQSRQLVLLPAD